MSRLLTLPPELRHEIYLAFLETLAVSPTHPWESWCTANQLIALLLVDRQIYNEICSTWNLLAEHITLTFTNSADLRTFARHTLPRYPKLQTCRFRLCITIQDDKQLELLALQSRGSQMGYTMSVFESLSKTCPLLSDVATAVAIMMPQPDNPLDNNVFALLDSAAQLWKYTFTRAREIERPVHHSQCEPFVGDCCFRVAEYTATSKPARRDCCFTWSHWVSLNKEESNVRPMSEGSDEVIGSGFEPQGPSREDLSSVSDYAAFRRIERQCMVVWGQFTDLKILEHESGERTEG